MIYMAGKPDHKQSNDGMIDHIVELVEQRAAQLKAAAEAEAIAAE
jgi:(E)-4-hydroxy-3-methylbut-2-enyl-diphosphate synthase